MATFQWKGGSADWNTPASWDLGSVPGSADGAVIAVTGTSYIVLVGAAESLSITDVTLNAGNATLEIDGTLAASGTVTLSAGTLADIGSLSAAAITDNALLAYVGSHTLDNTPLALGGTLQVQNAGTQSTLTLGSGEIVTQSAAAATIDSTTANSETVINQGTINAAVAGGSLAIVPLDFTNTGLVSAHNEALTIGYDDDQIGGVRGPWSNAGTIALSGTASLTLDGSLATAGIGTITGASGVTEAGVLDNTGATLNVGTGTELGTVRLVNAAVVTGGTIADHGNGFTFISGTLNDVTYQGPLDIGSGAGLLNVTNGLTVTGVGGVGPGTIDLTAGTLAATGSLVAGAITDDTLLAFVGSHTLDNTPLALGGTLQVRNAGTQSTLTLGSGEVITQAGATATINSTTSNGETVINDGTINAAVASGTMNIAPLNLTNQGIISAGSSEALTIGGTWSNNGTIAISGSASLTLAGAFKTAGIGTITGVTNVTFAGALDNTNATLNVGTGTELGTVNLANAASVTDGIIVDHGNGFTFNRNGTFNGVTYEGTLNIASYEGLLNVVNGLTVTGVGGSGPGTINLSEGGDAILNFEGGQTIDNATINLNGTDSFNPQTEIDIGGANYSVLTLGPNLTVSSTAAKTQADIRNDYENDTAVANQGTIIAAAKGGSFYITPPDGFANQGTIAVSNGEYFSIQPGFGNFNNTGTVSVTGGSELQISSGTSAQLVSNTGTITMGSGTTLDLTGYFTLPSLGNLVNQGATTQIDGTFDGLAGTITLGAGSELNQVLLAGQIRNATVVPNGDLTIMESGNASLWNDTYQGPIGITSDYTRLTIYQGVTVTDATGLLPGTITVSGQEDTLTFADQYPGTMQTLDNTTINIGNGTIGDAIAPGFNGGTFTIGGNATIVSATSKALASLTAGYGTTVLLDGTLSATGNGGTFTVAGSGSSSTFNNDGTILVGNGDTLKLSTAIAPDSNTGTIDLGSSGTLDIGSSYGAAASIAANQALAFTDATGLLKLRQPTSFAASISGFARGNVIDLPGIAADTAIWTAGTSGAPGQLAITDAGTAVATLSLLGDYTGIAFNVTSDKSGGSDIALACYAAGTRILTPRGEIAIERLREGDAVLTVSGAARPIRWIGQRRIDLRRHPNKERVMPVRIAPHAFGEGRPKRVLVLSPDHAVFVENVLIPIKYLVDGVNVAPVRCAAVTYYHIELPRHDVVLAEGMPAESYLEVGGRDAFANGGGIMQLHPDFHPTSDHCAMMWEARGYAALVVVGETIDQVRRDLARRTAMRGSARPRARPKRQAAKAA